MIYNSAIASMVSINHKETNGYNEVLSSQVNHLTQEQTKPSLNKNGSLGIYEEDM